MFKKSPLAIAIMYFFCCCCLTDTLPLMYFSGFQVGAVEYSTYLKNKEMHQVVTTRTSEVFSCIDRIFEDCAKISIPNRKQGFSEGSSVLDFARTEEKYFL